MAHRRFHGHHIGGLFAPGHVAWLDRGVHELFAHDPDHCAGLLSLRGLGHQPCVDLGIDEGGRRKHQPTANPSGLSRLGGRGLGILGPWRHRIWEHFGLGGHLDTAEHLPAVPSDENVPKQVFAPAGIGLRALSDLRSRRTTSVGLLLWHCGNFVLVHRVDGGVATQSAVLPRQRTPIPQHFCLQAHWHGSGEHQ